MQFQGLISCQVGWKAILGHAQFHDIRLNPALSWVTVLEWHLESTSAIWILGKGVLIIVANRRTGEWRGVGGGR